MVKPLRRVIVKRPEEAYRNQANIAENWKHLNFLSEPDFGTAIDQHSSFVQLLEQSGAEILCLPEDPHTGLDSIYTHDPVLVADAGAIILRMGKPGRRGEAIAWTDALDRWHIPILGVMEEPATAEAGDLLWLDDKTLLAGHGLRTNAAGIAFLRQLLEPLGVQVLAFHLPYWNGPDDVLHLMSFISMLDEQLAIVYRKICPVPLLELLEKWNVTLVDVADEEYDSLGCNVLAVSPSNLLMVSGNPVTRARLEAAGCAVREFDALDIAWKGSGGPTCLTRPLLRA